MTSLAQAEARAPDPDSGFSLVEVMVALVVISLLCVSLGGLVAFAVELKTRTETAQRLGSAVGQLEAFRNLLGDVAGRAAEISIANPGQQGFELKGKGPGAIDLLVDLALTGGSAPSTLEVHFGDSPQSRTTIVDLSPFDHGSIDYLTPQGDALAWRGAESVQGVPLASRLTMSTGTRQWSILLWVVPRDATEP